MDKGTIFDSLDIVFEAAVASRDYPVVISKYILGAKEVELDAVGQSGEMTNYVTAEHVENAAVQ